VSDRRWQAARGLEIRCRRAQKARIVAEVAEPDIASGAKQTTHLARGVAMIDAKLLTDPLADRTSAVLPSEQPIVVVRCEPVDLHAPLLRSTRTFFLVIRRAF
jgi:hypothetical protein